MDLTSIAQIVSGIATLVVALVLLIQIRQQHKDAEIQIAIMSETMNEKIYNFGKRFKRGNARKSNRLYKLIPNSSNN